MVCCPGVWLRSWTSRGDPSERITHAEQWRELLKDSAGGSVCSGHDLPLRKRGQVIPEITTQDDVLVEPELDAAAQADDGLPFIDRGQGHKIWQRLWVWRRTGDYVTLHASTRGEKRAD